MYPCNRDNPLPFFHGGSPLTIPPSWHVSTPTSILEVGIVAFTPIFYNNRGALPAISSLWVSTGVYGGGFPLRTLSVLDNLISET